MSPTIPFAPRVALADVAEVSPGYAQRHAEGDNPTADLRILQARDLGESGSINWAMLAPCGAVRGIDRFLLRDADVLLTIRTTNVRAVRIIDPPSNAVASAQFAIVRPDQRRLDPGYLAWVLGRAYERGEMRTLFKGSTISFLAVADLRSFTISLPTLQRQRAIARLADLARREQELLTRLNHARSALLDAAVQRTPDSRD